MNIFFSNQIEELYQELKKRLFKKGNGTAFDKRLIIVPSQAIKSWLMLQMAQDEDLMVAMGVEMMHLDCAIEKVIFKKKFPSSLELGLSIGREAKKMARAEKGDEKLKTFLQISENKPFSLKSERRLMALSLKLKSLFSQYGTYCFEMVTRWEKEEGREAEFQQKLWKLVFLNNKWSYPVKEFHQNSFEVLKETKNLEIHLFSINFLPKEYYHFFEKIASICPIHTYFLSPCLAFWSDLQSDRDYYALKNYLRKRGKEISLETYLRDENPLLANFGKLGREMAKCVEEGLSLATSSYVLAEGVEEHAAYEDFILEDVCFQRGPFTLLKAIQADLTFLRNPTKSEKIEIEDESVQFHAAPSLMREVQILYDNLVHLIKIGTILPSDVIIMAPDISLYEPSIRAVFGSSESLLPFSIMDIETGFKNPLAREFIHLLSLVFCRLNKESLMELFSGAYFKKAHGLTNSDLEKLDKWLLESDFRWGLDAHDRASDLKENHCPYPLEISEKNTLKNSISRLLASLVLEPANEELLNAQFDEMPLFGVQPSDAPLLGQFASLIFSLKEDLKMAAHPKEMILSEWISYLHCLLKAYFDVDEASEFLTEEELLLLEKFDELRSASESVKDELFSFFEIREVLKEILKKETFEFGNQPLNKILFCSMLPMRSLPAKVIAIMGMNEEAFPRKSSLDSLDLKKESESDYMPSQTDFDRYLFLEAILSARQYLLISYVENQDHNLGMSLVVEELLSYIENGYKLKNKPLKKHPFYAFHSSYFTEHSPFQSYSEFNYRLSLNYYQKEKVKPPLFIPSFEVKPYHVEQQESLIDLKDLSDFAKNPLKSYFNKKLGIYLRSEREQKEDEDFTLSNLHFSEIKKKLLREGLEDVLMVAKKKQQLPDGFFLPIATGKIEDEAFLLTRYLEDHRISREKLFRIDLEEGLEQPERDSSGNWKLPSLQIVFSDQLIKIVGSLPDVSLEGLLVHAKFSKADSVKLWPLFLVFSALVERYSISKNNLIFLKCGTSKSAWFNSPEKYLKEYLAYYFKGIQNPSPLIPEWAFDFIHEEEENLNQKIEKNLSQDFSPLYNDYLHWMKRETEKFSCKSFSGEWKKEASTLFLDLYEKWHTR